MPNDTTTNIKLPYIYSNQSQKEVLVNEAFTTIDSLLNNGAVTKALATPPVSPVDGQIYIVATSATGAWLGHDLDIAIYNSGWRFLDSKEGLTLWVNDENKSYTFDGTVWVLNASLPVLTTGSVIFSNSTTVTEDNSNFFWDNAAKKLGIGSNAPSASVEARATTEQLRLSYDASNRLSVTVSSAGSTTLSLTGTSPSFNFNQTINITGNVIATGSVQSSSAATNSNLYVNGASSGTGTTHNTTTTIMRTGATGAGLRIYSRGSSSTVQTANDDYYTMILGTPVLTAGTSGAHPLFAQMFIKPTAWTAGTGTVTNTASLYLEGAAAGTVTGANYNLWSAAGPNRLDGQLQLSIATVSANTTLDKTHYTVLVDATAASRTITLPAAASSARVIYNIKKIDSSANAVTIDANASETIDGALTKVISTQWASYQIHCDGTSWFIL